MEFSSEVASKTKEKCKSAAGTTQEIQRLKIITRNLLNLSQTLREGLYSTAPGYQALRDLCNECISLGEHMAQRLSRFKVQKGDTSWTVMRKAADVVWSKTELDELSHRLASFQSQLELYVLVSFRQVLPPSQY